MIKKVIVVGGGNAGYSVAVAIKKFNPSVEVSIFHSKNIPTLGVGESTVPQVATFYTALLGYNQTEFMRKTDSVFKFANKLENFYKNKGEYTYIGFSYNLHGSDLLNGYFYQNNNSSYRSVLNDKDRFTDYVLELYKKKEISNDVNPYINEHFGFLEKNKCPFDGDRYLANSLWSWAYHTDANKITSVLKETAIELGINIVEEEIIPVIRNNECLGVKTSTGELFTADLYIDSSGFARTLFKHTDVEWENFTYIPVDKAWLVNSNYTEKETQMTAYTRSIAMNYGWRFEIALFSRLGNGYLFSSKHVSDEEAFNELKLSIPEETWIQQPRLINFVPGRYKVAAVRNIVSAGISTGFLEPLLSNALYLSVSAAKKIAFFIQKENKGTPLKALLEEYNNSTTILYDSIYQYLTAVYKFTQRDDTSFWTEQKNGFTESMLQNVRNQYYSKFNCIENNINGFSIFPDYLWLNLALHYERNVSDWSSSFSIDSRKLALAKNTFKYIHDKSMLSSNLAPSFYSWHKKYIYEQ